jgi:hypothetical protein
MPVRMPSRSASSRGIQMQVINASRSLGLLFQFDIRSAVPLDRTFN